MRALITVSLVCALLVVSVDAQTRTARTFDIYAIDVEEASATLLVSPSGASTLIDAGEGGSRDVNRILDAVKDAGLTHIDNLLITHWHGGHFLGAGELALRIPIRNFIDHGPNTQQPNIRAEDFLNKAYPSLYSKAKHTVVKAGDTIPMAGLDWRVVSAAGEVIKTPLPGAGKPNPYCASFTPKDKDDDGGVENGQSVGSVIALGKFRMVHLGDLTWNKEFDLMCPNNPLGTVDLFMVSNHSLVISNSEVLVHALHPRVIIMNDGTRKGGRPVTMKTFYTSPGLENLWELHFSLLSGQEYTVPGLFIANTFDDSPTAMPVDPLPPPADEYVLRLPKSPDPPAHNGKAYWIKVSAQADGTFTVTNQRNQFSKTYRASSRMDAN
ncbi:MAG: MBL fold metallo-hydrolase [Candidatus Acidiferrales bacterium]|jgi:beta-lactamase superfamily II metal-dependent hydrolase